MKTIVKSLLISIIFVFYSCSSNNNNDEATNESINKHELISPVEKNDMIEESLLRNNDIARNYSAILGDVMHRNISLQDLEEVIPQTSNEFAIFYDSMSKETSPNAQRAPFHHADSLIAILAFRDSGEFFIRYLNMFYIADIDNSSEEYMENLFYGVDFAIDANYSKFIEMFNSMNDIQKECFSIFVR